MPPGGGPRLNDPTSSRIVTIPNLVSLVRILAVPAFLWLLLARRQIAAAGWLLLAIGSTDWVDGWLARRLGQVSKLGKALDPVADRLAIVAALIGGIIADVLPALIVVPLLVREVFMAGLTGWLMLSGHGMIEVRRVGKFATLLLYGAIPSFYVAAGGFVPGLFLPLGWVAGVVGLVLYYVAAYHYVGDARTRLAAQ